MLAWNLTAEVYAAIGEHDFSARVEANLPKPNDWVDRAAGDGSVVLLGQRLSDNPLGVPTTEFWNRSIEKVWSVDGTGPGPGDTLTPDLQDVDGTLWPDPETDYVARDERRRGRRRRGRRATTPRTRPSSGSTARSACARTRPASPRTAGRRASPATRRFPPAPRTTASTSPTAASAPRSCASRARRSAPRASGCRASTTVRIGELGRGADKQPAIARETRLGRGLRARSARRDTIALPDPRRAVARRGRDARRSCRRSCRSAGAASGARSVRASRLRALNVRGEPALGYSTARPTARGDEVREAHAEREPRERARCARAPRSSADRRPREPPASGGRRTAAARRGRSRPPAARRRPARPRYCRGFRSKTSFRSVNPATRRKNAGAVVGVVDRAEHRRRGDRLVRRERVEVAQRRPRPARRGGAAPPRPSPARSRRPT